MTGFGLDDLRRMTGAKPVVAAVGASAVIEAASLLPRPFSALLEAVKLRELRSATESLDELAVRAAKAAPSLGFKTEAVLSFQGLARKVAVLSEEDIGVVTRHAKLGLAEWTVTEEFANTVNDDLVLMLKEQKRALVESEVVGTVGSVRSGRVGMMFAPPEFVVEAKKVNRRAVDQWWGCVEQAASAGTTFVESGDGKIRPNFAGLAGCWASKIAAATDWRLSSRRLGQISEEMTLNAAVAVGQL